MFTALSKLIYRQRWAVLVIGIALLAASGLYGTSVFGSLKNGGFIDPKAESSIVLDSLHSKLGRDEGSLLVLFTANDNLTVESPEYQQVVETALQPLNGQHGVGSIITFYNSGAAPLVSNDHKSTYAVVGMKGSDDEQAKTYQNIRPLVKSDRLEVRFGGEVAVNDQVSEQVQKDLEKAETMSFPILAILLVFIFGSLIASALPLAIGGGAILGAFAVLNAITNFTDVSIFSVNIITMLGLGLAIDYSLFVVSRFREELSRRDGDVQAALTKTMQTAGRTVLFSSLTVASSLLALLVFPQMFLRSMGMGGAAAVIVAGLSSLTILPAALALLGRHVNSLSVWTLIRRLSGRAPHARNLATTETRGFWYRSTRFVLKRPMIVLLATLVPLVWVGLPFLRVNLTTADARSLPAGSESRVVSEILTNEFPRNETTPVQVLVNTGKSATEATSIGALYDYTRELAKIPGVTRVESLVNLDPRLDKTAYQQFYSAQDNPQAQQAAAQYTRDNYTLVSVMYDTEPLAPATQDLVRTIRGVAVPAGMGVQVGGNSAMLVDFLSSLSLYVPIALGIIVAIIFVLLFLMLGSVVIPVKAVIMNILSLSVSFGGLVWIFQDGNLANFFNFTPVGGIDGTQPVLIFAIAFGLSMDYEVFLLSRIKENFDRTGDINASIAFGVQRTGSIITSAAILLVVVIASFATGEISFIKQIGIGLSLAVLVDATLVRMFLVPAGMRLLGQANWWAPKPLVRLYERLGLGEVERPEHEAPVKTPVLVGAHDKAEAQS